MGFAALFLIGVGLSMDAFAVSVCKGLNMHGTLNWRDTGLLALFFGGFQALMPLAGWALGRGFEQYITSIDHWIAFGLLACGRSGKVRARRMRTKRPGRCAWAS